MSMDRMLTDNEIREIINNEILLLDKYYSHITISWSEKEYTLALEICVETTNAAKSMNLKPEERKFGRIFEVGDVNKSSNDYEPISIIQKAGKDLYYRLRDDYNIHRDLSKS